MLQALTILLTLTVGVGGVALFCDSIAQQFRTPSHKRKVVILAETYGASETKKA
jgi:hypothetical protein